MKKQLIVLLAIASLAIFGCEKCIECTTVTITTADDTSFTIYPLYDTLPYEYCGKEWRQQEGEEVTTYDFGGRKLTATKTTNCK